jgi:hypothetical protein
LIKILYIAYFFLFNFINQDIFNTNNLDNYRYSWKINYPENCNLPFSDSELKMLQYVYAENLKNHVLDKPAISIHIKHIFRNRIFIGKKSSNSQVKYPLLSSVDLFNIHNKNLIRHPFDKEKFNPFIYNFNFGSKSELIYRVDNSDYIIIIKSRYK